MSIFGPTIFGVSQNFRNCQKSLRFTDHTVLLCLLLQLLLKKDIGTNFPLTKLDFETLTIDQKDLQD